MGEGVPPGGVESIREPKGGCGCIWQVKFPNDNDWHHVGDHDFQDWSNPKQLAKHIS